MAVVPIVSIVSTAFAPILQPKPINIQRDGDSKYLPIASNDSKPHFDSYALIPTNLQFMDPKTVADST